MPKACYIHIPFCSISKCKYCTFVSYTNTDLITGYIDSLLKEIDENYNGEKLKTLYFGGGTPSLLSPDLIKKILNKFSFENNPEITLELNPEQGVYNYLSNIKNIGINRLSIGVQTFDNNTLKLIGRKHTSQDSICAINNAKKAGIDNISVDLIYGLPNQTITKLSQDIDVYLDLNISHISTYGLKIEGGSFWGKYPPKNIPDDDIQADMYEYIIKRLEEKKFYKYEVSNFAKPGFESQHNLTYWNNEEYYGYGVSAHGYVNGLRYSNLCNIKDYMKTPIKHEYGRILSEQEKLEETIFLGFRKTVGINVYDINKKFNIDFDKKYSSVLNKYKDYIVKTDAGYAFNLEGTLLSNEILPEFLS